MADAPQPFLSQVVGTVPISGIPQPFHTAIDGPITVEGIPDTFHINIDTLPTIHLSIDKIPKISIGVDPVELRLTELPSIRGHLPADFCIGLSVLGMELARVRLCGEAQVITEPYRPNPCEVCGGRHADSVTFQPIDVTPAPAVG